MQIHPVTYQTVGLQPFEPVAAIVYAVFLLVLTLLTMRRPSYGIVGLIVVQPISMYTDIFHTTITLSKVALVALVLGLAVRPEWLRFLAEHKAVRFLVSGGILVAATLLSVTQSQHALPAFRETLKALEYVIMFGAVYGAYRIDRHKIIIRQAVVAVAFFVSVSAISQELVGAPSGLLLHGHVVPRIAGLLEGPNQLAGYLDIMIPVLLAFLLDEPEAWLEMAIALSVFADLLTFSRGGELGAVAGAATVALIYRRNLAAAARSLLTGLFAGAVVAVAWSLSIGSFGLFRPWSLEDTRYAGGVGSRSELWRSAVRLWSHHPLLGIGAGNFEFELSQVGLRGIRTHANSLYLASLVEGGIPLFAATLWLTWTSIFTFIRDRSQSPFIAGALAASVALAIHQVVDFLTFYPKVGGWWWIVLALGTAEVTRVTSLKKASECV